MPGRVFALNFHANYACQHSGACCTAGWTIPVESDRQERLGAVELRQSHDGACRFFDRESHLCAVHRDHGESALPDSCQQFPRRALLDDRGTFITLSHYCPTAAALLMEGSAALSISDSPVAFPATRRYEGLDARGQWPPLLTPAVLFDLDSYSAFERFIVATLSGAESLDAALRRIAAAIERMREWHERRGSMLSWTEASFEGASHSTAAVLMPGTPPGSALLQIRIAGGSAASASRARFAEVQDAYRHVLEAVPSHHQAPPLHRDAERAWDEQVRPAWAGYTGVVKRYVAAKAVGSWTAYQGRGARTILADMALSALVLEAEAANQCAKSGGPLDRGRMLEALRSADWLLVHLVERQRLVDWLGAVEHMAV